MAAVFSPKSLCAAPINPIRIFEAEVIAYQTSEDMVGGATKHCLLQKLLWTRLLLFFERVRGNSIWFQDNLG